MKEMKQKREEMKKAGITLFIVILICEIWINNLINTSSRERLNEETVTQMEYRDQEVGEAMLSYIKEKERPAEDVALYLLESKFGYQKFNFPFQENSFQKLKKQWKNREGWAIFLQYTKAIWNDLEYFPVPESAADESLKVTFTNSWMNERTYGGKRGHEGCDLMASENVPGLYPVVSMTDGIVQNKGWLEKGGYRIGIEAPSGAYFYYAHLDSYASIEVGDEVSAGDLLGFMGDTGYGEEGTKGMFPVHLHVGIYIYPGEEMSVNPYWILRYLENRCIKCDYSSGDIE